jgi:putative transposase
VLIDQKLPGYRFPLSIIGHAVWLYHRYTLSLRDVEELLFERGIEVSRESIRTWCINFSDEFARGLHHREPRRGSRWHLDEMHVLVGGVPHWLWRAVDEYGSVLDVLLQRHRDTDAAKGFFERLLGEYEVPETVCTDKLASYSAAIRELPVLDGVDHQRVISTARCNNLIEQSHRPTRSQERSQLGFRHVKRTQGFLSLHASISNLHGCSRSTAPAPDRRRKLCTALHSWNAVVQQVA